MTGRWVKRGDGWGGTDGTVVPAAVATYTPADAGAALPVMYSLNTLPGTVRYVAPDGNDNNSGTRSSQPMKTVPAALGASSAGDSIVLRGGSYPIAGNVSNVNKNGIMITAYPGEVPVFDGSIPVGGQVEVEGNLRRMRYLPMKASRGGDGIDLSALPVATFDNAGRPTGLAAERGFANVTSATEYAIPSSQVRSAVIGTARVVTGIYPDQVWVDRVPLIQVFVKSLVRRGFFYVDRSPADDANDANPVETWLYLHPDDVVDLSKVRVSSSGGGYFLYVSADGVHLRGFEVFGHSPPLPFFTIQTKSGIKSMTLNNIHIKSCTGTSIKLYGTHNLDTTDQSKKFDGSKIVQYCTLWRVTIERPGFIGISMDTTDGTKIDRCIIKKVNAAMEFSDGPKSGAIKATKNHHATIQHSIFEDVNGHGIWFDQSNYALTFASNYINRTRGSSLFWEISHNLIMVNNLIIRGSDGTSSATIRISGGSGVEMINNTIIGGSSGSNPVLVIADPRGKTYTHNGEPRLMAEHTLRYGQGGSITDDLKPLLISDLDRARPGRYAALPWTDRTPGLDWLVRTTSIVNNVVVHPGGTTATLKLQNYAPSTGAVVPTETLLPSQNVLLDGNIYQHSTAPLAQIITVPGTTGSIGPVATITEWRLFIEQAPYRLSAERRSTAGTSGWVDHTDGRPMQALITLQGTAAVPPSSSIIDHYIAPGSRNYGSLLAPPGGFR